MEGLLSWCLLAWLVVELMFLGLIMVFLAPRMNQLVPPAKYPIAGKQLMYKIFKTVDWLCEQDDANTTFKTFFSGWFRGSDYSEIRRGNMVVFLAWAMYAKEWSATDADERADIMDITKVIEGRLGTSLGPGFNPRVMSIRHTLERSIPFAHRPLALYAVLEVCRVAVRTGMKLGGFRRGLAPCGGFHYWFREVPAAAVKATAGDRVVASGGGAPMVFFHGVGTGLPFYVLAIWKMCRSRTSVVVESPSIAMRLAQLWGHTPPSEDQLVGSVEGIMQRHGLKTAAFFGHSYGSIPVAWMARRKPHLVSQIVLLDPVCLLLFLPNVARSFLCPDTSRMPMLERVMLYLVTAEKGISHTLRRHFWWYANVLWPDDIHCPIVVGLAGQDRIVPSPCLRRYLLSHGDFGRTSSAGPPVTTQGRVDCGNSSAGGGKSSSGITNHASAGCNGGGSGGSGWSSERHSCGAENKLNGHRQISPSHSGGLSSAASAAAEGSSRSSGRSSSSTIRVSDGRGIAAQRSAAKRGRADGSSGGNGGAGDDDGVAKWVELVYWPDVGHGNALGDPWALDAFARVAARQEEAFLVNRS